MFRHMQFQICCNNIASEIMPHNLRIFKAVELFLLQILTLISLYPSILCGNQKSDTVGLAVVITVDCDWDGSQLKPLIGPNGDACNWEKA